MIASNLHDRYQNDAVAALQKQFGYDNPMQVPRLDKIVVNVGLGEALTNAKAIDAAAKDLATITGQKPIVTKAKRSIAQFRVRTGNPDRAEGHPARPADVGLPGAVHAPGPAPDPRLPGRSRAGRSTVAAITRSGCASRSRFPRSTTTRWTVSAGWRSAS